MSYLIQSPSAKFTANIYTAKFNDRILLMATILNNIVSCEQRNHFHFLALKGLICF